MSRSMNTRYALTTRQLMRFVELHAEIQTTFTRMARRITMLGRNRLAAVTLLMH
jgi:hypothetical protein